MPAKSYEQECREVACEECGGCGVIDMDCIDQVIVYIPCPKCTEED